MNTIDVKDFPPEGAVVIENTGSGSGARVVLLRDDCSLTVWTRHIKSLKPAVLGGWLCSPDAGVSLTLDGATRLHAALTLLLAKRGCPRKTGR